MGWCGIIMLFDRIIMLVDETDLSEKMWIINRMFSM